MQDCWDCKLYECLGVPSIHMNFVHGVIAAVGLLVAANLAMISADLDGGGAADHAREPAALDMMAESAGMPAPVAKDMPGAAASDVVGEPPT